MDLVPSPTEYDPTLYSEQMDVMLSEMAKTTRLMIAPPKRKFDRERFLGAVMEAFEQIGGVSRFTIWADRNPDEFYKICTKTIPQATMLDIMGKLQFSIQPALPPSPLDGDDVIDVVPSP